MIKGNEPIHPQDTWGNQDQKMYGLTIREEFSKCNMAALISKYNLKTPEDQQILAQLSVELADALITALNTTERESK